MTAEEHESKHILVVNDDESILGLFQDLLGEEGYKVTLDKFARKTSDILQTIRQVQPDLVIMDFIIGQENSGWQLMQAAKMDRDTRNTPIIVCTGAVKQVTELSEHLDAMGIHVVIKPFDIDHLLDIVAKTWVSQDSPTPGLDTVDRSAADDEAKMAPHRD